MNGLTTGEEHLKLIAVVFQNIVPPINVNTVRSSILLVPESLCLLCATMDVESFIEVNLEYS